MRAQQFMYNHAAQLRHGTEVNNIFDVASGELAVCDNCGEVISDVMGEWKHVPELYHTEYDKQEHD